jgi:hypothetical protein
MPERKKSIWDKSCCPVCNQEHLDKWLESQYIQQAAELRTRLGAQRQRMKSGLQEVREAIPEIDELNINKYGVIELKSCCNSWGIVCKHTVAILHGDDGKEIFQVNFSVQNLPNAGVSRGVEIWEHQQPSSYTGRLSEEFQDPWLEMGIDDSRFPSLVGVALLGTLDSLTKEEFNNISIFLDIYKEQKED